MRQPRTGRLRKGAPLDEHARKRTPTLVELRLDDRALGGPIRIGLQLEDFGLQRIASKSLSRLVS